MCLLIGILDLFGGCSGSRDITEGHERVGSLVRFGMQVAWRQLTLSN